MLRTHLNQVRNDKALRFRAEKWFWMANIPAALYLFFFERTLWDRVSILYLALVSIYALVLTLSGAEQAAQAAAAASSNE